MYNEELKLEIHEMFQELEKKSEEIIAESRTVQIATDRICNLVSSKVATESEGYIVDMYSGLVAKIKEEDYFKNPANLNAFYKLNLREKINEQYHFEIESLDAYKKGIEFKEVNELYIAAGTTAGTLAVGGILKFAISGIVNIPLAVIIAGAVLVGIATYFSNRKKSKSEYKKAVKGFLTNMENEIIDWLLEIEGFFNSQIRMLYRA